MPFQAAAEPQNRLSAESAFGQANQDLSSTQLRNCYPERDTNYGMKLPDLIDGSCAAGSIARTK